MDVLGLSRLHADQDPLPQPASADFVALDVETAAQGRSSLCSVGVALVRDGHVVASGSVLINPECEFGRYNTMITGLDADDVRTAPTLPEVWPAIAALLDGQRVCAHSATFDLGVLRASAARYSLPGPEFDAFCTWRIARLVWPSAASWGLGYIAPWLGIEFNHHQAGSDASASASVAVAALAATGSSSLAELATSLNYSPPRIAARSYIGTDSANQLASTSIDTDHPLNGKTLAFTGGMYSMTRREAAELIAGYGGAFKSGVSAFVDFLVICDADFVSFADGHMTGKLRRAAALRAGGCPIEIVGEKDFIALLNS